MENTSKGDVIVNLTRITVCPEKRNELCQTISSLIDPVKREKGCLTYHFYEEAWDKNTFVLIGEWETQDAWNNHLHSDNLAVLLGSLCLLCNCAHVNFMLLSHAAGIEAMARSRVGFHS